MTSDRPKLGFSDELDNFDPTSWESKPPKRVQAPPQTEQTASLAEASGFRSREPKPIPTPKAQRRYRTGRNTQFNIKAAPDVIKRFIEIADAQGWVFGEALEYAVELLESKYKTN